ncbi:C40 family peptidase [Pelomonas sp. UHG3]|jgi:cell wall-associated NlpC family hydrolase|uniref:C40 family peptidase n=1 Tax=Roseateles hydrophilus TaxID=2975054 RepID=A0ACC6C654_9BURK|nr:C40 family peptidase [Pelomonas sp. UHG3]MCY4743875.1 C40 family peptidase [Pelomonas sp. UHG3]
MRLVSRALLNRVAAAGLLAWGCAAHAQGVAQASALPPAPPPGTMTGAYGQSLQQQQAAVDKAAAAKPAPAATPGDAVSRFLSERGLLSTATGEPNAPARLLDSVRDTASDLVLSAMNFLGVRYTRGGNSVENGFDCSGFTRHIFEMSVGLVLPRRADEQAKMGSLSPIRKDELKPGDLVFFNTMRATFSHVGIYVGEGKFIHAPRTGSAVRVEDMRDSYWAKRFTGARRADLKAAAESPAAR